MIDVLVIGAAVSFAVAAIYNALVARCAGRWYAKWLMRDFRATVRSYRSRGGWRHHIISRRGVGTIHQEGRRLTASEGTYRWGNRPPKKWRW